MTSSTAAKSLSTLSRAPACSHLARHLAPRRNPALCIFLIHQPRITRCVFPRPEKSNLLGFLLFKTCALLGTYPSRYVEVYVTCEIRHLPDTSKCTSLSRYFTSEIRWSLRHLRDTSKFTSPSRYLTFDLRRSLRHLRDTSASRSQWNHRKTIGNP